MVHNSEFSSKLRLVLLLIHHFFNRLILNQTLIVCSVPRFLHSSTLDSVLMSFSLHSLNSKILTHCFEFPGLNYGHLLRFGYGLNLSPKASCIEIWYLLRRIKKVEST
jgi:hypothetical protein